MAPQPTLLFTWGSNASGQCGDSGKPDDRASDIPRPRYVSTGLGLQGGSVAMPVPVVAVAAGEAHTLLLSGYGDVFALGRAREGQLGLGRLPDNQEAQHALPIEALRPWRIVQIACGSKHSMAVSSDGRAFEWGLLLSSETKAAEVEPQVSKKSGLGRDFQEDLSEKERRIVAASWGAYMRNVDDTSGVNQQEHAEEDIDNGIALRALSGDEYKRMATHTPRACSGLHEKPPVLAAACGFAHSVVAVQDGSLLASGYSDKGQLGNGGRCPSASFVNVTLRAGCRAASGKHPRATPFLACGLNHSAVVTTRGQLLTWGLGVFGQLGLGVRMKESFVAHAVPEIVRPVVQVACGDHHTLALTDLGQLFAFGHRDAVGGQSHYARLPEQVNAELWGASADCKSDQRVERIYAGGNCCFAAVTSTVSAGDADNQKEILGGDAAGCTLPSVTAALWSWGYNQKYQLGRDTTQVPPLTPGPCAMPRLQGAEVRDFAAGASHSVAALGAGSTCCVLSPGMGDPCLGNTRLLAALRGTGAPYDVSCLSALGSHGAHRSVLRARCPLLAARALPRATQWKLDLSGYSASCVDALLEYIYTDYCRARADVTAELRPLAEELGLERLAQGCRAASETESVTEGMCWMRTAAGRWEQVCTKDIPGSIHWAASSYSRDLEALMLDVTRDCENSVESASEFSQPFYSGSDYIELVVQEEESNHQRRLRVARPVLLGVDYFLALLEGGFAESIADGKAGGSDAVVVSAECCEAFSLCLRILATGDYGLLSSTTQPELALAVIVEAHRLGLQDVVAAAEAALHEAVATGHDLELSMGKEILRAAGLYDLPRLCGLRSQ